MAAEGFELPPNIASTDPELADTYCDGVWVDDDNNAATPPVCNGSIVPENVRRFYPNQGLVLVEIFWEHDLLLDLPGFSPVFNIIGGDSTVINVWSAFPVASMSPRINFDPSWEELEDED